MSAEGSPHDFCICLCSMCQQHVCSFVSCLNVHWWEKSSIEASSAACTSHDYIWCLLCDAASAGCLLQFLGGADSSLHLCWLCSLVCNQQPLVAKRQSLFFRFFLQPAATIGDCKSMGRQWAVPVCCIRMSLSVGTNQVKL